MAITEDSKMSQKTCHSRSHSQAFICQIIIKIKIFSYTFFFVLDGCRYLKITVEEIEDGTGSQRVKRCVLDHHLPATWFISKKLLTSAQFCGCQSFRGQLS